MRKFRKPEIIIIASVDENYGIGRNNKLLFTIPEHTERFRSMTYGYPVIMGKNTWDSLEIKPIDGRMNIVITDYLIPSIEFISKTSIIDAIEYINSYTNFEKIFIIGGEQTYRSSLDLVDTIELTKVKAIYHADRRFPIEFKSKFYLKNHFDYDDFSFLTYKKNEIKIGKIMKLINLLITKKIKKEGYPDVLVLNDFGKILIYIKNFIENGKI